MPLTLLIVSYFLLLCIIAGGIVAYLGVRRAVDGFEDERGFHAVAEGVIGRPHVAPSIGTDSGDGVSARV